MDYLSRLFDTSGFMPHGHCYLWDPSILWVHVISNAATATAYFAIASMLVVLITKRRDVPFRWMFVLFATFIVLCGTGHLLEIYEVWTPAYRLSGALAALTGMGSIATAIALGPLIPQALQLRSPRELETAYERLQTEMSERERVEGELRELNATLEQRVADRTAAAEDANRAKSAFLANMSHEIRTPMTAILGFADVLLSDSVTAPADRLNAIQTIKRHGEYLLEILNGILDLSRIESGRVEVERARVSPLAVVNEVAALMRVRAEAKRLPLVTSFGTRLPAFVLSDAVSLRQILINLVANAIKFTDAGKVELRASFREAGADSRLELEVRDSGIGITAEQRDRLFQPFVQGNASVTRRYGGTGLGLAISQRLAQMLRGAIEIESEPGRGSTFRLVLPTGELPEATWIENPAGASTVEQRPTLALGTPSPAQSYACRVLLAEDGGDNRRLITLLLERMGATVFAVEDGRRAVDAALAADGTDHAFDLVLMDMHMPVLDGYEATRALRRAGYEGPIVAITANAMHGDRERCLEAGCTDFLSKPIERDRLSEVVAAASRKP